MLKRNRAIQILCSMVIGILFLFAVLAFLVLSGIFSLEQTKITISTESIEALYDSTPLTNHSWRITRGSLKPGHTISVQFHGSQTNVGESENTIDVVITDELGADVTSDYDITYNLGIIKVNPRYLIITSASDSKLFDGYPLQNSNFEITSEHKGLVVGHNALVSITGSITDIGETPNTIESVIIYDKLGADVTNNYHLFVREGVLRITSPFGASGMPEFDGESDLIPGDEFENAVLYSIYSDIADKVYLKISSYGSYSGKYWSEAHVYPKLINDKYCASYIIGLSANDKSLINTIEIKSNYQPYALPYYMVPEEGNAELQTNDVTYSGGITNSYIVSYINIGTEYPAVNKKYAQYESEYRSFVYENYLDLDDVSREFMENIIQKEGFSAGDENIIKTVATYIQKSAKYNLEYDPALEQESNIAIAFLSKYKEGVCRHYASAATLLYRALGIPARYTVGVTGDLQAGEWTNILAKNAHAWVEVYVDGTGWICVEVTGGSLGSSGGLDHGGDCDCTDCAGESLGSGGDNAEPPMEAILTPETVRCQYNGKALKATNKLKGFEAYEKLGYTYKAVVEGQRTEAGITKSIIKSITIYDKDKKDVTDSFALTLKEGTVQVYLYSVEFSSPSANIIYDGKPAEAATLTTGALASGDTFSVETTAKTDVGIRLNTFNVKITDKSGQDVTDLYYIKKNYGTLTILPIEITVKAGDATKIFDGTALTCHEFSIESGSLAEGNMLSMPAFIGSQTQIGRCDNVLSDISVLNNRGEDVTPNYIIKYIIGTLTITG